MTDHISINFDRLAQVFDTFRDRGIFGVMTTDIIEKYMGGFHPNKGVPVADSWNAQFGKYLKANAERLKISETASNQRVVADGSVTSASEWMLKKR